MPIIKRGLLLIVVCASALVATTALALWFFDPFVSVRRCEGVIPDANETLYFRIVSWGVAGGHWQVVLSPNRGRGRDHDMETEYMFDHPDGLLYRVDGKTLEIHSHSGGRKPERFGSMVTVRILNYDSNPDWLKLHDSRRDVGLTDVNECANSSRPPEQGGQRD